MKNISLLLILILLSSCSQKVRTNAFINYPQDAQDELCIEWYHNNIGEKKIKIYKYKNPKPLYVYKCPHDQSSMTVLVTNWEEGTYLLETHDNLNRKEYVKFDLYYDVTGRPSLANSVDSSGSISIMRSATDKKH